MTWAFCLGIEAVGVLGSGVGADNLVGDDVVLGDSLSGVVGTELSGELSALFPDVCIFFILLDLRVDLVFDFAMSVFSNCSINHIFSRFIYVVYERRVMYGTVTVCLRLVQWCCSVLVVL